MIGLGLRGMGFCRRGDGLLVVITERRLYVGSIRLEMKQHSVISLDRENLHV